ncbi:IMV membrane protein [Vaccinia virus]|uniref:Virion membrane protein OPG139 n=5 Tax=Vaccinia virus TaxID=10245 RepID=A0A6B7KGW8_VACCV|nr:putative IMV membrane protein [Vaccinia virus]ABZ80082.1 IMV membrane protein [synthetic Vaccinia virus]AHB23571.1 IMV membrane protein [Vaccinia virus WAU86/88-1]BBD06215.1 putative A13L [BAC cloning vector pLC16m8.8S-BAC]AAW23841.1 putative IMV membrane protein [Vaccinia virus]
MIGILLLIGICVAVTVAILYSMYNKIKNLQNPNPSPNLNSPPPEPKNTKFVNNLEKDHISSLYNLVKSSA